MTFGPFAPDIEADERRARLRAMRALALVYSRQNLALAAAEHDPDALGRAFRLLDYLPALSRRKMLATYATLARPGGRHHERREAAQAFSEH